MGNSCATHLKVGQNFSRHRWSQNIYKMKYRLQKELCVLEQYFIESVVSDCVCMRWKK